MVWNLFVQLAITLSVTATPAVSDPEPLPFEYPWPVQVFDLPESANGIGYRLYVRPPLRAPKDGSKPATFYFLDPLTLFVPAAAMSYNWEYFNYMPAAYFVGVGYQNEADGTARTANRTRDYTPTAFEPPNDKHFLASKPADWVGSGGADAFLSVLEKEIVPFISRRFEVDPRERVLVGKSMSGLAAVHSVLTRPALFRRYVIVSPAIWWDDFLLPRSERYVMKAAAKVGEVEYPAETRVYFAVGEAEERLSLVSDLYVLADALRRSGNPQLKVHLEVLPGEQHEGVFPAGFMRGIVGVYSGDFATRPAAAAIDWSSP